MKNNGMSGLYIVFDGSCVNEDIKGSSHLIEHLLCKNYDYLLPKLQEHNIKHNAYTSNNEVVFWFTGLEDELCKFSKDLVSVITCGDIICTEDQFINEQKTVIQEYLDTFNDQNSGHYYNVLRQYVDFYGPIGKKSDIEKMTLSQCNEIVKSKFKKPSRIITIGNLYYDKTDEFSSVLFQHPIVKKNDECELEKVTKDGKTSIIGIFSNIIGNIDKIKVEILVNCLNSGLESPLYQEIREKRGLSYFSWLFDSMYGDDSIYIFGACTTNEQKQELIDVYSSFFNNIEKYINENRFNIIKNKLLILSKEQEILRFDKDNCNYFISEGRDGFIKNQIENVTFDDIMNVTRFFKRFYISEY